MLIKEKYQKVGFENGHNCTFAETLILKIILGSMLGIDSLLNSAELANALQEASN